MISFYHLYSDGNDGIFLKEMRTDDSQFYLKKAESGVVGVLKDKKDSNVSLI
jgi:hypothetical protein